MQSNSSQKKIDRSFCVAPMMKCTDRYFRQLARTMTHHALLYTEMITCKAAIYGNPHGILDFAPVEQPLALQIGGRDLTEMAMCAELAQQWGYAEININAGCPSKCAQSGGFGAHLMKEPAHLAKCVAAISRATDLPLSIKCRTGVDEHDSDSDLFKLVEACMQAGCRVFIVHARSALLGGKLSPKQNRTIPPLNYQRVYRLKDAFPECTIIINGGIHTLHEAQAVRAGLDGVMVGRAVYHNPLILKDVDALFYNTHAKSVDKKDMAIAILGWVEESLNAGVPTGKILKHILSLFKGQRYAREWRRWLSDSALKESSTAAMFTDLKPRFEQMMSNAIGDNTLSGSERIVLS